MVNLTNPKSTLPIGIEDGTKLHVSYNGRCTGTMDVYSSKLYRAVANIFGWSAEIIVNGTTYWVTRESFDKYLNEIAYIGLASNYKLNFDVVIQERLKKEPEFLSEKKLIHKVISQEKKKQLVTEMLNALRKSDEIAIKKILLQAYSLKNKFCWNKDKNIFSDNVKDCMAYPLEKGKKQRIYEVTLPIFAAMLVQDGNKLGKSLCDILGDIFTVNGSHYGNIWDAEVHYNSIQTNLKNRFFNYPPTNPLGSFRCSAKSNTEIHLEKDGSVNSRQLDKQRIIQFIKHLPLQRFTAGRASG